MHTDLIDIIAQYTLCASKNVTHNSAIDTDHVVIYEVKMYKIKLFAIDFVLGNFIQ